MTQNIKQRLVDYTLLLLVGLTFFSVSYDRHSSNMASVINSGDVRGYYVYLPEVFVDHSVHLQPSEDYKYWHTNDRGEIFTKFTCGVAYCYLPFFFAANVYVHATHGDASGYSLPYAYAIMICAAVWAMLGLYFLKKILVRYFSREVTWVTLLCIALGTNLYNYATFDCGMSHVYSFALFAALIFAADCYYKNPGKGKAILMALLYSWIILIRPTNVVLIVFLLLYQVNSAALLKERMSFISRCMADLAISAPFFVLLFIPQMLYWKEMTGHWVLYSYMDEGFKYLARPKIAAVLFDTQNGLFTWSPILLFFPWAIFMRNKDQRTNALAVSIVFIIITYVFASWWAFWFGGAFGHRCYVEYYTILAFPLAITIERIFSIKGIALKLPFLVLMVVFCYYNIAMSALYLSPGYGVFDGPGWRWNWDALIGLIRKIF